MILDRPEWKDLAGWQLRGWPALDAVNISGVEQDARAKPIEAEFEPIRVVTFEA
jgi:hypothetical protein